MRIWGRGLLAASVIAAAVACTSGQKENGDSGADKAIAAYAAAWSKGGESAAALTDNPRAARTVIAQAVADLGITKTSVRGMGVPTCTDKSCNQRIQFTHTVSGIGDWSYETTVEVRQRGAKWQVHWTPASLHSELNPQTRFRVIRELPPRAAIQDRDGKPLTKERPVVRVKVDPHKVTEATYNALRDHLGVDRANLRAKVTAALKASPAPTSSGQDLVRAITVREGLWAQRAGHLKKVPGVIAEEGTLSLATEPSFARAVIGSVGTPDDAATLANAGPGFLSSDDIGLGGLQKKYQRQLAGRPGGRIELFEPSTGDITSQLSELKSVAGKPIKTTLSVNAQVAAEGALSGAKKPTSVVAVQASTGEILAAANGPGVTVYNRAFVGKYPPGSTFKVVSTAALLANGLKVNSRVACPPVVNIGGKNFRNANNGKRPDGPFSIAFAFSCNTTIVSRAESLGSEMLTEMALKFGIGEKWDVGLPTYEGSVPEPGDLVDRAATMIGQSRVLMSPLGMALVAATVAGGQPHTPSLIDGKPGREVGSKLDPAMQKDLQGLMRAVVTTGSAKAALSRIPGVFAKTGTAEYGTSVPLRTHAWMIGYRGDVAFAVVIEDGGAGGKDAGPVAKRFLEGLRP